MYLRAEMSRVLVKLDSVEPGTPEYKTTLEELSQIANIYMMTREDFVESRIDRLLKNPAFLGMVGNLVLAGMILYHERAEIITSRAFGLVRPK